VVAEFHSSVPPFQTIETDQIVGASAGWLDSTGIEIRSSRQIKTRSDQEDRLGKAAIPLGKLSSGTRLGSSDSSAIRHGHLDPTAIVRRSYT